jgi:trehalose 6-phosphate phosphatase
METQIRELLQHPPFGLLLDIDGTLSPIAPTPEQAFVPAATRTLLREIVRHVGLVAAISGRAAGDAAAMLGVEGMVFVGNHGMELARHGRTEPFPEAAPFQPRIQAILEKARAEIDRPGLIFEDKGVTASVHYRLAADPEATGQQVGEVLTRLVARHDLRLTAGRMVWEIRPPIAANKGTAVRWLVDEYGLRSSIFCGDDRTDVDGFEALRALRDDGRCRTLSVGVVAPETPAIVRDRADLLVEGIEGMERLLATILRLLESRQEPGAPHDSRA